MKTNEKENSSPSSTKSDIRLPRRRVAARSLLVVVMVVSLLGSAPGRADKTDGEKIAKKAAVTAARQAAGAAIGKAVGESIGKAVAGGAVGTGVGAFLTPSEISTKQGEVPTVPEKPVDVAPSAPEPSASAPSAPAPATPDAVARQRRPEARSSRSRSQWWPMGGRYGQGSSRPFRQVRLNHATERGAFCPALRFLRALPPNYGHGEHRARSCKPRRQSSAHERRIRILKPRPT